MSTAEPVKRRSWWRRNALPLWLLILGTIVFAVFIIPDFVYFVHPGQVAVLWLRFFGGTVTSRTYGEGTHLKAPWDSVYIYDTRIQQTTEDLDVLSSDGLQIKVLITTRFRLVPAAVGELHQVVGPDYVDKLVIPEVGAHFRTVMAQYDPEQLYTTQRAVIQQQILDRMRKEERVQPRPGSGFEDLIYVEDVLIRDIELPPQVKAAIDHKLAERHLMLEYDYRLQLEEKERQRKIIEAQGIRSFQEIISNGISDRYLKWKGIDATLELAKSPNSKIVVVGNGKDGLPLILGPLEPGPEPAPTAPARGAAPPQTAPSTQPAPARR